MAVTGSIAFKIQGRFFSLQFSHHGWLAAELVQYLDEIVEAEDQEIAVLKLLGYTLSLSSEAPTRKFNHWVEIYPDERLVITNSGVIRKAVDQKPPETHEPFSSLALRRIYQSLDRHDFTVKFLS